MPKATNLSFNPRYLSGNGFQGVDGMKIRVNRPDMFDPSQMASRHLTGWVM
jgi:hypothetical protein